MGTNCHLWVVFRLRLFWVDFGARCAVFGLDFGARYVVRRFWGRFRCTVRRFWARFWGAVHRFWARFWCAVCGVPILGPWCTAHGFTRCWCRRCTLRLRAQCPVWVFFGARCAFLGCFWCAVRRFWAPFWCTVCGAPLLGPISVHGAPFWVRFWCVAF